MQNKNYQKLAKEWLDKDLFDFGISMPEFEKYEKEKRKQGCGGDKIIMERRDELIELMIKWGDRFNQGFTKEEEKEFKSILKEMKISFEVFKLFMTIQDTEFFQDGGLQ